MTVSENLDNKHYDVYLERQLQQALLKADDEFARRDHFEVTRKTRSNFWKRKGRKDEDGDLFELTGWTPENNTALRKTEKNGTGSGRSSNREYISWRDGKIRRMDRHYFNFRHYKDTKKYIEQYRRECTCAKNTGVSSKECLELKPYQCFEKCNAPPNSKKVSRKRDPSVISNKPHIFSYTNRANPVSVHTDFYNGNNLAHVMENNVSQILRTDSENLAQEKFGRRIHTPSRGSATPGRDRNSVNELDHKAPILNGSHRIPSATKLPPSTKIRTLDVLKNSPDSAHQSPIRTRCGLTQTVEPMLVWPLGMIRSENRLDCQINKTQSAYDVITTPRTACSSSPLRTTMQQHRDSVCHSSTVRDGSGESKYINMTHHRSKKSPTNASDNSSYETVDRISSSNTKQGTRRPSKSKTKKQLPTQETPTDAGQTQDSCDMSWRDKLHALRQVNKPHNKQKQKERRLIFYKEDYEKYDIVCNPCVSHRRNIQEMIGHSKLNGIYGQIGSTLNKPGDTFISSFLIKKCDVIPCSNTKTDEIIDAVRDCQEHNYALRPMPRYNKANT